MHSTEEKLKAFERLLEIMDELRAKCPWDKEQTLESLRNLTIEETYELADAIMQEVNTAHAAGYGMDGSTGNDFFSGTGASGMQVNSLLVNDLN